MGEIAQVRSSSELDQFCSLGCPAPLSPDAVHRYPPDSSWLRVDKGGQPPGRCSLWWSHTPACANERVGVIGHYGAPDEVSGCELLNFVCHRLAEAGCTIAIGPMDGNTWQRYRLLSDRGTEPLFFLEPDNPDDWPAHWLQAGFEPLAEYYSAVNDDLARKDHRLTEISARLEKLGIRLRTINLDRFEQELKAIYALSIRGFAQNFLYTPIGADGFLTQYRAVRPFVQPELVLIAERQDQPVGFLFTVPDMLQARRGQPIDTVILKSMAVDPDCGGLGLGTLLIGRTHEIAHQLGYRRAIHALMHEANKSRKISNHSARTIRRYTLYARRLIPA
jgi:GNAT superfamily N-acetyltransferase